MRKIYKNVCGKTMMNRPLLPGLMTGLIAAMAAVFLFAAPAAYAQSETKTTGSAVAAPNSVIISSKDSLYSLNNVLQVVEVPRQPVPSFVQAIQRFKSNQATPVKGSTVSLGYGRSGYWILFNAYNRSQSKTLWMLDFGSRDEGSIGTADRVAIYTSSNPEQPVMIQGRNAAHNVQVTGQQKNAVPVNIDTGQNRIIGIYIEPTAGVPVTMTLQLIDQSLYMSNHEQDGMKETFLFLLSSLAVVGFFMVWRSNGFKKHIPAHLAIYTAATCLAYATADEIIPLQASFSAQYLGIIKAFAAYAAIALSYQVLVAGGRGNRFGISIAGAKITIVALGILAFFAGSYITFPSFLLNSVLPLATAAFITCMAVMTAMHTSRPQAATYAAGWSLLLLGAIVSQIALLSGLGSKPALTSLYWTFIIPHLAIIAFASLRFLSVSESMIRQERMNQKEKQEEEAEMRKTRELADQSRLFSIMQREKELMADLRNRESERAQAMRKAKDIADQANKAKSDFLAVISHEIRTPMTGIMGMIRLMLDTPLNERQKEFARTIQYSGETLLTLLNDILDLSKAEEGKMSIEVIDFDIVRLAQSVAMLMSGRTDEKKIYMKADIDPQVPVALKGDPTRLRQILLNLVGNAIKFTEQGGVTISIKLQEKSPGKKPRIYFGVSDTGIGISPEAQKKLFQPYAQADASTARKFGGTGLGLSICKKLVEAMGSTIQIQSEPGKGTTFYFILSLDQGELAEEEQDTKSGKAPGTAEEIIPLKILVVDDNDINQRVVAGLLERDKHTVTTVGSAKAGFAEIEKGVFDIILMDMEMPEIDGVTASRMIREMKDEKKASQIIIAMTGNTSKEDIERCKQAGMNDYLSKPINPDVMRKVLNSYGKKKMLGQASPAPALAAKPAAPQTAAKAETAQAGTAAPAATDTKPVATAEQKPAPSPAPVAPLKPAPPAADTGTAAPKGATPAPASYKPVPPPVSDTSKAYTPAPPPVRETTTTPGAGGYVPVPPPVSDTSYKPVPPPVTDNGHKPVPPPVDAAHGYTPVPPEPAERATAPSAGGYTPVPPPVAEPMAPGSYEPYVPAAPAAPAVSEESEGKVLFDKETLGTLKDSLGVPALTEMMDGLYEKTEELITAAEKAVADGDQTALAGRGHDIKGMTANFGIKELSNLGGQLERQARDKVAVDVLAKIVEQMRPTYSETRKALDAWMAS